MDCDRRFFSTPSHVEKLAHYPGAYDEQPFFYGEEKQASCSYPTLYEFPRDSNSSGYPVWLGLAESIPTFNHDSPSSYEESELSASPASYEGDDFSMNSEDEQPCEQSIQLATAFHPNHRGRETDLIIASNDDVYFYAHTRFISDVSPTALQRFLRYEIPTGMKQSVISLPLPSPILNIILHALYKTSCANNAPTCDELIEAVDNLAFLGLTLSSFILPDTPLYAILLSHAPCRPLDIFALAAHHDLFDLAQYTSSHLLTLSFTRIGDELSVRIGARYLKRIFFLQMSRTAALKQLVMSVPCQYHTPTLACGGIEQQKQALTRAWAMGASTLAWEMVPDSSVHHLHNVYTKLGSELRCRDCRDAFDQHLKTAIFRWSEVKTTIQ